MNTMQVQDLTSRSQLQEIELEKTTRQLKEALALAAEETAKCKAAKEVIKSLTAQVSFILRCSQKEQKMFHAS